MPNISNYEQFTKTLNDLSIPFTEETKEGIVNNLKYDRIIVLDQGCGDCGETCFFFLGTKFLLHGTWN